jgi:hypothetical protein
VRKCEDLLPAGHNLRLNLQNRNNCEQKEPYFQAYSWLIWIKWAILVRKAQPMGGFCTAIELACAMGVLVWGLLVFSVPPLAQ